MTKYLKCYKSYITILKILKKRGYIVDTNNINKDYNTFVQFNLNNNTRSSLNEIFEKVDNPNEKIYIFFPDDDKLGVKTIRNYVDVMKEHDVTNSIILVKDSISPFAKQALKEFDGVNMNYFTETETQYDITEHKYQPKFALLTTTEKQNLLKKYNLTDGKLPIINMDDPIARYYGLLEGDIIKIIRSSETAGRYITYRVCCL